MHGYSDNFLLLCQAEEYCLDIFAGQRQLDVLLHHFRLAVNVDVKKRAAIGTGIRRCRTRSSCRYRQRERQCPDKEGVCAHARPAEHAV